MSSKGVKKKKTAQHNGQTETNRTFWVLGDFLLYRFGGGLKITKFSIFDYVAMLEFLIESIYIYIYIYLFIYLFVCNFKAC